MSRNIIPFVMVISCLLFSCGPLNQKPVNYNEDSSYLDVDSPWIETQERVPYYRTLRFSDGQGYEFRSDSSNKLIITLDGGGDWFGARVDEIGNKLSWNATVNWFLPFYGEYNIFVPEKFDWGAQTQPVLEFKKPGKVHF